MFLILTGCSFFEKDDSLTPSDSQTIDSTWVKNFKQNVLVSVNSTELQTEIYLSDKGQYFNIDYRNLVYFKSNVFNVKGRTYTTMFYFNADEIKKFINKNSEEIRKIYGQSASLGLAIGYKIEGKSENLTFSQPIFLKESNVAFINVALFKEKEYIPVSEIYNYASFNNPFPQNSFDKNIKYVSGQLFEFSFQVGIITDNLSQKGFYSGSKILTIDPVKL